MIGRSLVLGVVLAIFVGPVSSRSAQEELSVCASGCDFTSVSDAVADASDGATIAVGAGLFQTAPLALNKNLTVRGQGASTTTIRNQEPGATFMIVDAQEPIQVTFEGVTLDALCNSPTQSCMGDGIRVLGKASLALNETNVANHPGIGVDVHDAARVSLNASTISGNGVGLALAGVAQAHLTFSSVEGNAAGIEVQGDQAARLELSSSSIANNGSGVRVLEKDTGGAIQSTVELFDVQVGNNVGGGFRGGGAVSIRSSTLFLNGGSGLVFFGEGALLLTQSRIFLNTENGIELNCTPGVVCARINQNEVYRNGLWGLKGESVMLGECQNNFFHDNHTADFFNDDLKARCA